MSPSLPTQFLDLYTAYNRPNGSYINVMGVVTDCMTPKQSQGTDWTCTFSLADHTYGCFGSVGNEGLKTRMFAPTASELPPIRGTGDVLVLRGFKVSTWQGVKSIISNRSSSWSLMSATSIPKTIPPSQSLQIQHKSDFRAPKLSLPEMLLAIELCNYFDRSLFTSTHTEPASTATPTASRVPHTATGAKEKFSLIKDLDVDTYRDLIGQVVKMYSHNDREELYLTDYTSHSLLWNYNPEHEDLSHEGGEYGYLAQSARRKKWPGPWGKQTLTITLWSPHAYFAQTNVKADDFVRLRNVHVRWSKDMKMEGILHTDKRYPDRIEVSLIKDYENDDLVKDVLRRKRDYWKKYKQQQPNLENGEGRGKKRKGDETEKPLSKNQARKKRKREREEAQRKANTIATKTPNQPVPHTNGTAPAPVLTTKQDLNPNIRCANHTVPPRPLSAIKSATIAHQNTTPAGTTYNLPFVNINSRAIVRILDFSPPNLSDFAVRIPKRASEYAILSDATDDSPTASSSPPSSRSSSVSPSPFPSARGDDDKGIGSNLGRKKWEWRFALTLTDASPSPPTTEKKRENLKVFVSDHDAEHLLKLDACDLRKQPTALAALREKLFLLWGDLEERKARHAQATGEKKGDGGAGAGAGAVPLASEGVDGREQYARLSALGDEGGWQGSRPFHCCIKEYGVKVRKKRSLSSMTKQTEDDARGSQAQAQAQAVDIDVSDHESEDEDWKWERRWRMWGCTIV